MAWAHFFCELFPLNITQLASCLTKILSFPYPRWFLHRVIPSPHSDDKLHVQHRHDAAKRLVDFGSQNFKELFKVGLPLEVPLVHQPSDAVAQLQDGQVSVQHEVEREGLAEERNRDHQRGLRLAWGERRLGALHLDWVEQIGLVHKFGAVTSEAGRHQRHLYEAFVQDASSCFNDTREKQGCDSLGKEVVNV